jgi:hypothetical protein
VGVKIGELERRGNEEGKAGEGEGVRKRELERQQRNGDFTAVRTGLALWREFKHSTRTIAWVHSQHAWFTQ